MKIILLFFVTKSSEGAKKNKVGWRNFGDDLCYSPRLRESFECTDHCWDNSLGYGLCALATAVVGVDRKCIIRNCKLHYEYANVTAGIEADEEGIKYVFRVNDSSQWDILTPECVACLS